jgi:hypothetical protein
MARYADLPTVTVEVVVAAAPSRVWPLVADINMPAKFSSEFIGAEWIEGESLPAVGACFRGRNAHPATGEWQTTSTVVACDTERAFAWQVQGPSGPSATWRFELEPVNDGTSTRLRQWAQMGPGPSGLTAAIRAMPDKEERIVERRLQEWRTNMMATVEGIKALAEESQ